MSVVAVKPFVGKAFKKNRLKINALAGFKGI